MSSLDVRQVDGGIVLGVKVVPGSSRTVFAGEFDGMLKIKLSAAPEKGKANKCLIEYMAKRLKVRKTCISIISGATKSVKQLQILDVEPERLLNRLSNLVDTC
jgi:uncharacterized protein (TIGR00251 family)